MSDDNPFGRWMQENGGDSGSGEIDRITDMQRGVLDQYTYLINNWDASYWAAQLSSDERIIRHTLIGTASSAFYKVFRELDGTLGDGQPALTLERLVHVMSVAIGSALIISKGLTAHGNKTEDPGDHDGDNDDPPF